MVARCPQRVHSSIWPPSAAVRQRAMATRTLIWVQRIQLLLKASALRVELFLRTELAQVGGIVRVLNGSEIEGGRMRRVRLPRKSIEVIQVVEYFRAFL